MTSKNELAEERTDRTEDRMMLANEWTFAGRMRTGMAALGITMAIEPYSRRPSRPGWQSVATLLSVPLLYLLQGRAILKHKDTGTNSR